MTRPPTFAEWQATGHAVRDLGRHLGFHELLGRVYMGETYIEALPPRHYDHLPPQSWLLTLGRDSWTGPLADLEPRLFDWWLAECFPHHNREE